MGGEKWGQEKLSHQKNLIFHFDTHENGGRGVIDEGVFVHMCAGTKGIYFHLSITPL